MDKILVIGAAGQIGSELILSLRKIYGNDNVVGSDKRSDLPAEILNTGPFETLDVLNKDEMASICKKHGINMIVNLAAILSAVGEQKPRLAWDVNMNGMMNVLDIALEMKMKQVFVPSSIAAFGPGTPLDMAPQDTILRPTTMYGLTKVAGELLGDYYVKRYGLDVRGVRFPGIISHATLPGGGTTDYAVAIYYDAIKHKKFTCFVNEKTKLPMMYMPDCIKAVIDLMQADFSKLKHHNGFNVGSMSFTPVEIAESIKKHIPEFSIDYKPDFRQAIADSWPDDLDDSAAREEWGWNPTYNLELMTDDMLKNLKIKFEKGLF
ncbi:MAG: NAD-dependent epimerase/dehydratase family protein [Bacteroidales bacterium]|jgi:nucleoside-diphosphate-sugar epimerase|nr:NAD-dependent epimerase/dehydratase family protein [Bacteroidales bacterium]OQA86832.1 MAG: putative epimerase/dehydratase [Bacteroidetes bacterium ADurb.Bin234]